MSSCSQSLNMNYPMSLATDSSGFAAPHHHGHQWVVIVFNLLPFFGGQFAPLFHDTMANALKAYSSNLGPKHLAQGLLVTEADLSAGLLHGHLLAYCRRRWLLLRGRWETDEEVARRIFYTEIVEYYPLSVIVATTPPDYYSHYSLHLVFFQNC